MNPGNESQHDRTVGISPGDAVPEASGVAQMTLEGLRPTTAVLSVLYLLFAFAHAQLPHPLSTTLMPWALCSAVLLLWLRWQLRRSHKVRLSIHTYSVAVAVKRLFTLRTGPVVQSSGKTSCQGRSVLFSFCR